ncbi:Beta-galactosidase [Lathyrus oleraceus]|uniref:Beta-galactosidase n=1 Tax=Pisum sativum TaxID=3888 RepID=A0A9D4XTJ1_PEA|nr:Beta-galactosidase [Pisum sativum]
MIMELGLEFGPWVWALGLGLEFGIPFHRSLCKIVIRKRFGDCPNRNVLLSSRRTAPILPKVRAQNLPGANAFSMFIVFILEIPLLNLFRLISDYVPDSKFYKIEAILRPWRIPHVSSALLKMGIRGVTVSDVKGFGAQGGSTERQGGSEFSEDSFVVKVKMEIVVRKNQVEAVLDKILESARTGEIGDGKIFLMPVSDVIRVRTGERAEKAERMAGGLTDLSSVRTK